MKTLKQKTVSILLEAYSIFSSAGQEVNGNMEIRLNKEPCNRFAKEIAEVIEELTEKKL